MNERRRPGQLNLSFEEKLSANIAEVSEPEFHEPSEDEKRLAGEILPLPGKELKIPNRAEERRLEAEAKKAREKLRHQLSDENLLNQQGNKK